MSLSDGEGADSLRDDYCSGNNKEGQEGTITTMAEQEAYLHRSRRRTGSRFSRRLISKPVKTRHLTRIAQIFFDGDNLYGQTNDAHNIPSDNQIVTEGSDEDDKQTDVNADIDVQKSSNDNDVINVNEENRGNGLELKVGESLNYNSGGDQAPKASSSGCSGDNFLSNNKDDVVITPLNSCDSSSQLTKIQPLPCVSVIQISRRFALQLINNSPHIYVIDNFLTKKDLAYLHSLLPKLPFARSFIDDSDSSGSKMKRKRFYDTSRTSSFVHFDRQENSYIANIERRAADILGVTIDCIEPLQLVRYLPGQRFDEHHDMGVLYDDGSVEMPTGLMPRRLVTLFVYLNTLSQSQGGCTAFPEANGIEVQPVAGRAVMFSNITKDGYPDIRTVHCGKPVRKEIGKDDEVVVKYGINIWITERSKI